MVSYFSLFEVSMSLLLENWESCILKVILGGGGGQWHKMEKMENYSRVFPFSP